MKKRTLFVAAAALLAFGLPALAQKNPTVASITVWKTQPGAGAAFAEGRKKHMDFHRQQKDAWGWHTWEIIAGEREGQFLTGTFGHYWKDFDGREAFDALDGADSAKNLMPHVASAETSYWAYLTDSSRPPAADAAPPAFLQIAHYYVNVADTPRFEDALEEVKAALDKVEWPVHSRWYRLISGGRGPQYVLSTGRANWAAFAPPEKTLLEGLTEAVGARRATELLDAVRESTKYIETEIFAYRADLSYEPAK
ncbi:MAG: hypothetical protein H6Q03_466 [Acidobacteria bacterium]|jgi:hypothetical protein|nr:hypothetical protein [Acidobacteriota bacterium]